MASMAMQSISRRSAFRHFGHVLISSTLLPLGGSLSLSVGIVSDALTSVKGFIARYERFAYTRDMVKLSGDEIKRRREALGMSQSELAAWTGVHVRTISKWERGIHHAPEMLAVAFRLWEERPEIFNAHAMRRRPARQQEDGE